MPSTAPVYTADEKARLTAHLGISGGSTDAQIMAAMQNAAGGSIARVQTGPTPACPECGRLLPNNKTPAST